MALHPTRGRLSCAAPRILAAALVAAGAASVTPVARDGPVIALRLPPERVYDELDSPAAVVFSHESHAAYADNRCLACHPQPFSILGRHRAVRHEEMDVGGACGICHNGRDATDARDVDSCLVCHTGLVGATAATAPAVPPSIRLTRRADSPGQVTFRHATHAQPCRSCHREPFAMQAGTTALAGFAKDAMVEGATCGRCHNGQVSFGVDDGDHCETCHATEEEAR